MNENNYLKPFQYLFEIWIEKIELFVSFKCNLLVIWKSGKLYFFFFFLITQRKK